MGGGVTGEGAYDKRGQGNAKLYIYKCQGRRGKIICVCRWGLVWFVCGALRHIIALAQLARTCMAVEHPI